MESEDELRRPILNSTPPPPPAVAAEEEPPVANRGVGGARAGDHIVDSRLEEVLSNTELPWLKKVRTATWIELDLLFRLAAPAILVYLINNLMSSATRAFAGHLGNLELAAANLGNSGIHLFAYGLMVCSLSIHFNNDYTN